MGNHHRQIIFAEEGSFHLMSRVVGGAFLLGEVEKAYFLNLLERLARVFYVNVYAYCIMGNHFHILAGLNATEAETASKEELLSRYERLMGKGALPPDGSYRDGEFIADGDDGIERLRRRLASISCFMQALKQGFSRWYNLVYNRTGYFWSDRFKSVIFFRGEGEFSCSAYIDLNPVRAQMVEAPEDYRWSSFWLKEHEPERASAFLTPLPPLADITDTIDRSNEKKVKYNVEWITQDRISSERRPTFFNTESSSFNWYKGFVYASERIRRELNQDQMAQFHEIETLTDRMEITNRLNTHIDYFSRGIAIGKEKEIEAYQQKLGRKHIRAWKFLDASWAYATRALSLRE